MRDTPYATEVATASIQFTPSSEARIERIHVKEYEEDEIRFSWWKDGRMTPRPLDLAEGDLLRLLSNAVQQNVFTDDFRSQLKDLL